MKHVIPGDEALLNITTDAIHCFYSDNLQHLFDMLDENFMWIGPYYGQYSTGKKAFITLTQKENPKRISKLSDISFHVLEKNSMLDIVAGRFTIYYTAPNNYVFSVVRASLIWRNDVSGLKLMHMHLSDARDVPLLFDKNKSGNKADIESFYTSLQSWMLYIREVDKADTRNIRIPLNDLHGYTHFLLPIEIISIQSNDKICTITSLFSSFSVRLPLSKLLELCPFLTQIHRRYLINPIHVSTLRPYEAIMDNNEHIPVSRPNYAKLKESLISLTE